MPPSSILVSGSTACVQELTNSEKHACHCLPHLAQGWRRCTQLDGSVESFHDGQLGEFFNRTVSTDAAKWNPSVEYQAMDRIHRLGQRRPVTVTKIVIEDSIEEQIVQLQNKKLAMTEVSCRDGR